MAPRTVLTATEVLAVFDQPDILTPTGIRDRAILGLIWATGIRRDELVELATDAVDLKTRAVTIAAGTATERTRHYDPETMVWLSLYRRARSDLLPRPVPGDWVPPDDGPLFVNHDGGPLDPGWLDAQVARYYTAAGFGVGSCRLLRVAAEHHHDQTRRRRRRPAGSGFGGRVR